MPGTAGQLSGTVAGRRLTQQERARAIRLPIAAGLGEPGA